MVSKRRIATTAVATFGAAMTTMYVAPELHADILDITWNGGNATASNPYFPAYGTQVPQDIDQVGGALDFGQWNDTFGRTFTFALTSGLVSGTAAVSGAVIDPNTFVGLGAGGGGTFAGTGTAFLAFRSAAGNVGWFEFSFTQSGAIVYGEGEYGSAGETVTVGGSGGGGPVVPEPTSAAALAGLALGAGAIRRRRK